MARRSNGRRTRPPARRRRTYHHGDLANALVRVSLTMVEAEGVEAFSLREAATRCGVAVSAAYKHYANRSDLLSAVADVGFTELGERMETLARRATGRRNGRAAAEARLVAIGRAYILFAVERPALFRLMFGPRGPRGGGANPRPEAPAHRLTALLVGALEDVHRAYGHPAADQATTKVVAWSLVHGFATMVVDGLWDEPGRKALDAVIAELGATMLRSLA